MQKNLLPNPPGHASHPTEHAQGLGADQGLIEERTGWDHRELPLIFNPWPPCTQLLGARLAVLVTSENVFVPFGVTSHPGVRLRGWGEGDVKDRRYMEGGREIGQERGRSEGGLRLKKR